MFYTDLYSDWDGTRVTLNNNFYYMWRITMLDYGNMPVEYSLPSWHGESTGISLDTSYLHVISTDFMHEIEWGTASLYGI